MRTIPIFAPLVMVLVILTIFQWELGLGHYEYPKGPKAVCSVVHDDHVILEYEQNGRVENVVFNEKGYYFRDPSRGVTFKHWFNDALMMSDRHVSWRDLEYIVVSDWRSFQVEVDKACFELLGTHRVMKWAYKGHYY